MGSRGCLFIYPGHNGESNGTWKAELETEIVKGLIGTMPINSRS